ncbi:MAG TPA: putative toxin-antitoxin system toxin component, PIN family, partial [Labilithrix sp.]|nr:putative toxin-antitoxin system toxin component, PIN family [Labilithrix sp.]
REQKYDEAHPEKRRDRPDRAPERERQHRADTIAGLWPRGAPSRTSPASGTVPFPRRLAVQCRSAGRISMRIVVDTNVIVSALLKPGSVPDRALTAIWQRATLLFDHRIADEYREVLTRPKFRAIGQPRLDQFLANLRLFGTELGEVPSWTGTMSDADDRIFVEAALAGRADAIVTGNIRDYPTDLGIEILPPATVLARLEDA